VSADVRWASSFSKRRTTSRRTGKAVLPVFSSQQQLAAPLKRHHSRQGVKIKMGLSSFSYTVCNAPFVI
jgi:hypothetical protein